MIEKTEKLEEVGYDKLGRASSRRRGRQSGANTAGFGCNQVVTGQAKIHFDWVKVLHTNEKENYRNPPKYQKQRVFDVAFAG